MSHALGSGFAEASTLCCDFGVRHARLVKRFEAAVIYILTYLPTYLCTHMHTYILTYTYILCNVVVETYSCLHMRTFNTSLTLSTMPVHSSVWDV